MAEKKEVEARKPKLYKLEKGSLKRLRQSCPRCGDGVFLADHGSRLACGKCGYTEFKKR